MSPSCSTKPWRRWRSGPRASTSTPRSAAAAMRARSSTALGASGRLVGIDRDPAAEAAAAQLAQADSRFVFRRAWFSELPDVLAGLALAHVDGVLLDLGISSPQIDDATRGFSFRHDGPLDMRMDPSRGESAAEFLARATVRELTEVLRDYGEERSAQSIARAVAAARAREPIHGTRQLAALVAQAIGTRTRGDWRQDPATRTFQALRIFVNRELSEVTQALPAVVSALTAGGRHCRHQLPFARGPHRQAVPGPRVAAVCRRSRARAPGDSHRCAAGRAARARRARGEAVRRRNRAQSARAQRRAARRRAHRRTRCLPDWPRGYAEAAA